jgi:hypothetical protein
LGRSPIWIPASSGVLAVFHFLNNALTCLLNAVNSAWPKIAALICAGSILSWL